MMTEFTEIELKWKSNLFNWSPRSYVKKGNCKRECLLCTHGCCLLSWVTVLHAILPCKSLFKHLDPCYDPSACLPAVCKEDSAGQVAHSRSTEVVFGQTNSRRQIKSVFRFTSRCLQIWVSDMKYELVRLQFDAQSDKEARFRTGKVEQRRGVFPFLLCQTCL